MPLEVQGLLPGVEGWVTGDKLFTPGRQLDARLLFFLTPTNLALTARSGVGVSSQFSLGAGVPSSLQVFAFVSADFSSHGP
jgi:hypothetical protein